MPVAICVAVTLAPAITAPLGSVTVPVSVAFAACWPNAEAHSASNSSKTVSADLIGIPFVSAGVNRIGSGRGPACYLLVNIGHHLACALFRSGLGDDANDRFGV